MSTLPCTGGLSLSRMPRHSLLVGHRARVGSFPVLPRLLAVAVAAEQATQPPPLSPSPSPSPPSPPPPSSLSAEDSGPVELSKDEGPFAIPEAVSPLQSAASILLTGAIAVFLYRSLQRRAKLGRETRFRSSGLQNVKESVAKEPVLTTKPEATTVSRPSAFQTFQGALTAGAIALVLYKFTTLVESGFASKPVSPVYTIRQLTITVRTIINGLCYLATFVFAANSIGLTFYTIQLLFNLGPPETPQNQADQVVDQDPSETESLEDVRKE